MPGKTSTNSGGFHCYIFFNQRLDRSRTGVINTFVIDIFHIMIHLDYGECFLKLFLHVLQTTYIV